MIYESNAKNELYHYGVLGMKWGVRKKFATRNRQLASDRKDLDGLNNGKHLSVGLTKKRQAAYDARDRAILEKRIARNESKTQLSELEQYKRSQRVKGAVKGVLGVVGTLAVGAASATAAVGTVGYLAYKGIKAMSPLR